MTTVTSGEAVAMERRGVRIVDTFAEAFDMRAARVIVTAKTPAWARTAVATMTGFATSVIGCKVEAALEAELPPEETPDGRPGASALLFAFDADGLSHRLLDRIGQTILTCPTTSCFDGLPNASERVIVGGHLRHFGDKYQSSRSLAGHRYWRIPVMEGEFLIEEKFGVQKGIGGGNFLILGRDADDSRPQRPPWRRCRIPGVILPFPGGMVRAGKVGARNYKQSASTNDAYCPTIRRRQRVVTELPIDVNSIWKLSSTV